MRTLSTYTYVVCWWFARLWALIFRVLGMIEKNWIQILNQHWKLHRKMVSNAFKNIFGIGKNASQTFLRAFLNAIFNSKQISSSKHFSKMLLKARNWLWINHLITPSFHVHIPICVTCNYSINFTMPDVVYNSGLYRCTSVTRFVCFSDLAYNIWFVSQGVGIYK